MMRITLCTAALVLTAAAARADVTIIDNGQKVNVDCAKDKTVNIVGNKAVVTLSGTCERVNIAGNHASVTGSVLQAHVPGNHNTLTLDGVDEMLISGNHNTVSYKKGVKSKSPKVANPGNYNKVSQTK